MAGFIPESKILEIQRSVNIVDLVSLYIPLKRAGANYKALCPFHDEKTPSFTVNPSKQIFRCFGCNVGGDIFKFVMAYEKVDFPEAVRIIAEKYGIKIAYSRGSSEKEQQEKTALYKTNKWAAGFFHQTLLSASDNFFGRTYLKKRGINESSIARFLLGYIPDSFNDFADSARLKDISLRDLLEAGLVIRRQDTQKDEYRLMFRNRIAFPIFDTRDRVVGFGARALDDSMPKYINTPETPVFFKGKLLYALNFAKGPASQHRTLILVEGYTDVIMAHQFGFEHAVATLGTALTKDHIMQMRRYTDTIIAVYDADTAGKKASERSLDMFLQEDITLKIASLPEGTDPCDCLLKYGADRFKDALEKSLDLFSYRLKIVKEKYDLKDISQKARAIDELLESTWQIPNEVKRNLQLREIAEEFGVKESVLYVRAKQRFAARFRKRTDTVASPRTSPQSLLDPATRKFSEEFISLLLTDNSLIEEAKQVYETGLIHDKAYSDVVDTIFKLYDTQHKASLSSVLAVITDKVFYQNIIKLLDESTDKGTDISKRWTQCLKYLEKKKIQNKISNLKSQLNLADKSNQNTLKTKLLKELMDCEKMLRTKP